MLFLQPLVAVACGPHTWELLPNSRYREKRLLFESYYYCINKITGRPEKRILFCRGKWTKYQIWALVVRLERFEFFQSMQSTGIPPITFSCSPALSVSPVALRWWALIVSLGKYSYRGRLGWEGQESAWHWQVQHTPGWSEILLGIARRRCQFKFTQGGECKGRLSTSEPLVKAERWRGKKKH